MLVVERGAGCSSGAPAGEAGVEELVLERVDGLELRGDCGLIVAFAGDRVALGVVEGGEFFSPVGPKRIPPSSDDPSLGWIRRVTRLSRPMGLRGLSIETKP